MPLSQQELQQLKEKACQIRKDTIDTVYWAGGGHVGGSLSFTEIMVIISICVLIQKILNGKTGTGWS